MLEYLNFCLLCATFASILYLYIRIKKYFPMLKMAEELIGNLGYETLQSDTKHQKLLKYVHLGKVYTEEQLAKLNEEEVEKLFNNYEAKLSGQMVKSLGCSIINMYSMGACSALGIRNQEALKLCSSKIYLRIVLQIWIILSSLKHWNNNEQTLFI